MQAPSYTPTVPEMIRQLAARFGPREAMVLEDRRVTYAQIEADSAAMARALLASGMAKGTHVGLLLPNSPDWVIAWLALARIGAVVVPINTFYQARELGWALRHADIHTLITVSSFLGHDYIERLEAAVAGLADQTQSRLRLPSLPYLRAIYAFGACDRKWAQDGHALREAGRAEAGRDPDLLRAVEDLVTPADPLTIIYSSGSEAEPKGAIHSHGALVRHSYQLAMMRDVNTEDRIWSPMPFFWVGGLLFSLLGTLHHGACLVAETAFEPGRTLELIERERVTLAAGWPHYGKAMADHPSFRERDLSAVRGGNLMPPPPGQIHDPGLRGNSLGMTETCGPHTYCEGDLPEELRGSFGPPVPGLEHRIVDPESGRELPPGELGEICVRGYSLMLGLYKRERAQTFDADGFYHSGDMGFFNPAGHLLFRGRKGDMIKTAGANVSPAEVENVLEAQPEVRAAYTVGVPDPDRGEIVAAAVVLRHDARVEADALRERLGGELAAYKVPRHLFAYESEALPFTDSGKIDRRRLRALLEQRIRRGAPTSS